jgi:hypothetical protein
MTAGCPIKNTLIGKQAASVDTDSRFLDLTSVIVLAIANGKKLRGKLL